MPGPLRPDLTIVDGATRPRYPRSSQERSDWLITDKAIVGTDFKLWGDCPMTLPRFCFANGCNIWRKNALGQAKSGLLSWAGTLSVIASAITISPDSSCLDAAQIEPG